MRFTTGNEKVGWTECCHSVTIHYCGSFRRDFGECRLAGFH